MQPQRWTPGGDVRLSVAPLNYVKCVKNAERDKRIKELHEFHAALSELVNFSDSENRRYSSPPTIVPKPAFQSEWGAARAKVDRLSARAAHTLESVGVGVTFKPAGTMQTVPVNPAASWSTMLSERPMFSPADLESCIIKAIGALEADLGSSTEPRKEPIPGARHVPTIVAGIIIGVVSTVAGGLILWWIGVGR